MNGKKYIGYAVNIPARWKEHKRSLKKNYHNNIYLQHAWNKYGKENFKFWIVEKYPPKEEILKLMEIYFIEYYNSFIDNGYGYNMTKGGDGRFGFIPSDGIKKIMSEKMSGKNNPNYGKTVSDEQKQKISNTLKGRIIPAKEKELQKRTTLSGKNHPGYDKKGKSATSVYHGVYKRIVHYKNKIYVYWLCGVDKKHIGMFKSDVEAAKAYDKYVVENKTNRLLNFPEENCYDQQ